MLNKTITHIQDNINGLLSNNDKIREKHFKELYTVCETKPDLLYPYWDIFAQLLYKPEVSNKYYGIHFISQLIVTDIEDKFNAIFNHWFVELLNDESPVVALHTAEKSGMIVKAKPKLEKKITSYLLNTDETSQCRHLDLQKAYVLSAIDMYYNIISDKTKIDDYIKLQTISSSGKTKKKAKELVKKYSIN
ncbi:MAG: hypothetical protein JXB49_37280 [Bacteroidales bacterium]|nr:hypothetical protein [Bacteroidales bacterium]